MLTACEKAQGTTSMSEFGRLDEEQAALRCAQRLIALRSRRRQRSRKISSFIDVVLEVRACVLQSTGIHVASNMLDAIFPSCLNVMGAVAHQTPPTQLLSRLGDVRVA